MHSKFVRLPDPINDVPAEALRDAAKAALLAADVVASAEWLSLLIAAGMWKDAASEAQRLNQTGRGISEFAAHIRDHIVVE